MKKNPSQGNHQGSLTELSSSVKLSRYAANTAVDCMTRCNIGALTAEVRDDYRRLA